MKTLRIGLTGGIASGKTTVANLFAAHGIPVIDADVIARELVQPGNPILQKLVDAFGPATLLPDGTLDRPHLRAVIFADPELRKRLDGIMHPAIRAEMLRRSAAAGGPYQILAIPLLVETGADYIDRVLAVDVSPETQLKRLIARDGGGEAQARAILAAQVPREQRLARADEVVTNESDLAALKIQIDALHEKYRRLALPAT